jgi:hypothetical protein
MAPRERDHTRGALGVSWEDTPQVRAAPIRRIVSMSDSLGAWAYRPRHGSRSRLGSVAWAFTSVLRLAALMALLLAVLAGLTVGVGYLLVHDVAGLLAHR